MKRPSVEASLKPLKSFQRRTVEHAFHRLFTAKDGTGRFLVADEVGLGKTLVARGIIARAIDRLWNEVERIDIVYICSNGSIARANLPKLQVGGAEQRSFALATRLTMLATELAHREGESGLAGSKLNFVSFTPGTSFNMGDSAGQGREREVLFQLLDPLVGPRTALMNLLQGWITKKEQWRWRLENNPRPIDDTIRQSFEAAFHEHPDLQGRLRELADRAHPLDAPAGQDRRAWVRARVEELLADPGLPNPQGGNVDDRWEWAAPLLLDPELPAFLGAWRDGELHAWSDAEPLPQPNPDVFRTYVDDLLTIEPRALGRRPPDLADLLTDIALGSPAILAARSLRGGGSIGDGTRRRLAALIADAFWRLFNRPAVIALLRQLAPATAAQDESAYWRLVLRYCQQGNLQAVLDEQWHMLWDQESWSEDAGDDETAAKCARKLVQVVHPTRARVHGQFFRTEQGASGGSVERDELRVRTVFALRFGHLRTDDDEHISQDAVRAAFNSPFRPFLLASTSTGQDGLDFHPWCHPLIHWNLPGNPVDLEQREGRIHRYKGHAVRRNVAASHVPDAFASWSAGQDIWKLIFDLAAKAARAADASELVPYWIAPGEHRGAASCSAIAVHGGGRGVRPAEASARGLSGCLRATAAGGVGYAARPS